MPPSSQAAYQSLQDFSKNRQTPDAAIAAGQAKYGVQGLSSQLDALRTITGNLQQGIRNVDPSVTGRTSGSLVTEAARNAIVNNERAPLVSQFNDTSNNLNEVNHQYENATGLASNYANSLLQSDQQRYNELFSQYTTLAEQERLAAAAAEAKRQFDAQMAESQAARRAAAGAGSEISVGGYGGGGAAAPAPAASPQQLLMADIRNIITPDYATRFGEGYTERQIARLQQAYAGKIDPATIAKMVYDYRRPYEKPVAAKSTAAASTINPAGLPGYNAMAGKF